MLSWNVNAQDFRGLLYGIYIHVDGWLVAEVVKQKIKQEAVRAWASERSSYETQETQICGFGWGVGGGVCQVTPH